MMQPDSGAGGASLAVDGMCAAAVFSGAAPRLFARWLQVRLRL